MAIVFDGRKLAARKEKVLQKKVQKLVASLGFKPRLVAIAVGQDPASQIYLGLKEKIAQRIGVEFEKKEFSEEVSWQEVITAIREANKEKKVWGILVQLPLPTQLAISNQQSAILDSIVPQKDVDCLTPENLGLLAMGEPRFLPATVRAVMEIVQSASCIVQSANVVIVGGSNIVGKPLALVLSNLGATVTLCRSRTENLASKTCQADILISATGVPNLIKKEMVKRGAVVIDVGSPRGDVDFTQVKNVASFITPVPGGVGPMTVISLFENLLSV